LKAINIFLNINETSQGKVESMKSSKKFFIQFLLFICAFFLLFEVKKEYEWQF